MTKHIGIVAVSAEDAALCYRTICVEGAELLGRHAHPEVTMHTYPLADSMRHIDAGKWDEVGEMLLSSAEKLRKAGADLLICPDNTAHQAVDIARDRSPLPWLHIAEEVATVAAERGCKLRRARVRSVRGVGAVGLQACHQASSPRVRCGDTRLYRVSITHQRRGLAAPHTRFHTNPGAGRPARGGASVGDWARRASPRPIPN